MTASRAAEFAALAGAAIDPRYRALWQSQAEAYGAVSAVDPKPAPAFRLPSESAWAQLFDALGVTYEYNARFFLPDRAAWLKVLSQPPTERELAAARGLVGSGRVYMVTGWPRRKGYGLWVFSEAGDFTTVRPDFSDLALCNLFDCSFKRLYQVFDEVKR